MKENGPNYKRIYSEILQEKHPDKIERCQNIISKKELSSLDILNLNKIIFNNIDKETETFNQKHNSYDYNAVVEILNFQKENNCTNIHLSKHFNMSRNTIARWKKNIVKSL